MADDDVSVQFGAAIGGLLSGVDQVKDAITSITAPVQAIAQSFAALGEAVIVAFAVERIASFIDSMADLGEQITRTSAMLGVSTKTTQELGFIAVATGGSVQSMTMGMERLQISLQAASVPTSRQALALKALGLSAKEMLDVPINEQVLLLADSFKKLHDEGINPSAAGLTLMGRGAAGMTPMLEQGREGVAALLEVFQEAGGPVSHQFIAALDELYVWITALGTAFKDMNATIVGVLAPAFSGLVRIFVDVFAAIKESIDAGGTWKIAFELIAAAIVIIDIALATAIGIIESFWELTKAAAKDIGALWTATGRLMMDAFTFNFGDIKNAWTDLTTALQTNVTTMFKNIGAIAKTAGDKIKTALGIGAAGGAEAAPGKSINFGLPDPSVLKEQEEAFKNALRMADEAYNQTKEQLSSEVKLHEISYDQETALLEAALDKRWAAEQTAFSNEISKIPMGSAEWKKAWDQQSVDYQKFVGQHNQLTDQMLQEDQKAWLSLMTPIESAFNSQLRAILGGTETWGQAMKKILGDLVISFIEGVEKMVVEWLAFKIATAVGGPSTAAVAALKAITASAAQTGAEVTAQLAAVVGFPAALAAGTAAEAGVIGSFGTQAGAASFDVGSWSVPGNMTAQVHSGEMIIPAAGGFADAFRTAISGGGGGIGGGTSINLNGTMIGSQAFLNSILPQLQRLLINAAPLSPSTQ